jgi:hypothetical protein
MELDRVFPLMCGQQDICCARETDHSGAKWRLGPVSSDPECEVPTDYLEAIRYWTKNIPAKHGPYYRSSLGTAECDRYRPFAPVQLNPAVGRIKELSRSPHSSTLTELRHEKRVSGRG